MRFWLQCVVSVVIVDEIAGFSSTTVGGRRYPPRYPTTSTTTELFDQDPWRGGYSSQHLHFDEPSNDSERGEWETNGSSSSSSQNGSHDVNNGSSYLNQISGSTGPTRCPSPHYLDYDNGTIGPTSAPGFSSYTDGIGGTRKNNESSFSSGEVDPWSGYPVSSSNETPRMINDSNEDQWERDFKHLKEQVSQLGSDLSFFSGQIGSVMSAQTTGAGGNFPSRSELDSLIQSQVDRVKEAQSSVTKQLESSVQDLRASLSKQNSRMETFDQGLSDQTQRLTFLKQTVHSLQDQFASNTKSYQERIEDRLKALEGRLAEQQEWLRSDTSTRTDPRVQEMEMKLEEQADLLHDLMTNPPTFYNNLEDKIEELHERLLDVKYSDDDSSSRMERLERQLKNQMARIDEVLVQSNREDMDDSRISELEEKLGIQEEQLKEATATISDARVTTLRAKLIEQQEELESSPDRSNHFVPTKQKNGLKNPSPAFFTNPFDNESKPNSQAVQQQEDRVVRDGKKNRWSPFGGQTPFQGSSAKNKNDGNQETEFPLMPPPTSSRNPNSPPPPPEFGSYRPSNVAKESIPPKTSSPFRLYNGPSGSSKSTSRDTAPAFDESYDDDMLYDDYQYADPPSTSPGKFDLYQPPPPLQKSSPPDKAPRGSFKGNAFGRAGIFTIATENDQKPVDIGPRKARAEAARPLSPPRARDSQPPSLNRNEDRFAPPRANNGSVQAPGNRFGPPPFIPPDQSHWDTNSPNPDTVKRPLIKNKPIGRTNSPQKIKISPDQDQWDPDRPNPDAVQRLLIEKRPRNAPGLDSSDQVHLDRGQRVRNGGATPLYTSGAPPRRAAGDGLPRRVNGLAANEAKWDIDVSSPNAVNEPNYPRMNGAEKRKVGGVLSDQGKWQSGGPSRIPRDIDDIVKLVRSPLAGRESPQGQSNSRRSSPSNRTVCNANNQLGRGGGSEDMVKRYLRWCDEFGKQPSDERYQQFARNFSELESMAGQTGQVPVPNAYADWSYEEIERFNNSTDGSDI